MKAKAASLVGGGDARARAVEKMGVTIANRFDRPKRGVGAWVKALRPQRWIKNGLIFLPAIISMRITDPATLQTLMLALLPLCATASGTYILNDLVDLHADRVHPNKQKRPFASGRLKVWQGFVVGPALIIAGLVGGLLLSSAFAAAIAFYVFASLAYSLKLKRVSLASVPTLALLNTLRVVMGMVLAGMALSVWPIALSMLLFTALSLASRHLAGKAR